MPAFKQILKVQIFTGLFVFSAAALTAQGPRTNLPSMPEMPSISNSSGPSMPKISNPTLGTKYYTPNINRTYNSDKAAEKNSTTQTAGDFSETQNSSINEVQRLTSSVKAAASGKTKLSASDLLSMNNSGLFSNLYGLLETDTCSSEENSETLLKSIISQLEEIKTEQEKLNKKLNNLDSETALVTYNQDIQKGESILRFSINGYNILDTCRTVYFSKKENDGTFLLTGDRKYYADNKLRDETFYLLFKANGNSGTAMGYVVQTAIIQDYQNTNSFLYKLSQKSDLHATKTGNLVSLKSNNPDLKIDLLLDIGE